MRIMACCCLRAACLAHRTGARLVVVVPSLELGGVRGAVVWRVWGGRGHWPSVRRSLIQFKFMVVGVGRCALDPMGTDPMEWRKAVF